MNTVKEYIEERDKLVYDYEKNVEKHCSCVYDEHTNYTCPYCKNFYEELEAVEGGIGIAEKVFQQELIERKTEYNHIKDSKYNECRFKRCFTAIKQKLQGFWT